MSDNYRIFGVEMSPYSIKTRAFFRFKNIPHEWIHRSNSVMEEFKKYAKLPLVPAVATPEGEGLQDSTIIMEEIDRRFSEPVSNPEDEALAFLSALLEEYGDEWGNKWMFHYRWSRDRDIWATAERLARTGLPEGSLEHEYGASRQAIADRMVNRVGFVGSSTQTAPIIEASFREMLELLEIHLQNRPFIIGTRPCYADFGISAQVYETLADPTTGALMREIAPGVCKWCITMQSPSAEGEYETIDTLLPTLSPLLTKELGGRFLPWSLANAEAIEAGAESMSVELDLGLWEQKPHKYHARSLDAIRKKYATVADKSALDVILADTGCLDVLKN